MVRLVGKGLGINITHWRHTSGQWRRYRIIAIHNGITIGVLHRFHSHFVIGSVSGLVSTSASVSTSGSGSTSASVRCVSAQTDGVVRGGSLHTRLMWFYMYFMLNSFNLFACTLNIYLLCFCFFLFLFFSFFSPTMRFCIYFFALDFMIINNYY